MSKREQIIHDKIELKEELLKATYHLTNLAEAARELEMIFMTSSVLDSRYTHYLLQVFDQLHQSRQLLLPEFPIPSMAVRIQYTHDAKGNEWIEKRTDENITKENFIARLRHLMNVASHYAKTDSELLRAYSLRQKSFYQSLLPLERDAPAGVKQDTEDKGDVVGAEVGYSQAEIITHLTQQFEQYSNLLCLSPQKTAMLVYKRLQSADDLTIKVAQTIILDIFVGRYLSSLKDKNSLRRLLHPQILLYIADLADIVITLYPKKMLKESLPAVMEDRNRLFSSGTLAQSDSSSSASDPSPKKTTVTVELTAEEYAMIQQLRQGLTVSQASDATPATKNNI